jgi:hypothetical protein
VNDESSLRRHPAPGLSGLAALALLHCQLPHADENLPSTAVADVNRNAIIRLLAPPSVRKIGTVVPVTVEVDLADGVVNNAGHCVRVAAHPGEISFPVGNRCGGRPNPGSGGSGAGAAGRSGAGGGNAASAGNGGRANAATPEYAQGPFPTAESCPVLDVTRPGRKGATEIAAYLPEQDERSATLFASVYASAECTGHALATTAVVLQFGSTVPDPGEGGDGGDGPQPTGGASGGGGVTSGGASGSSGSSGAGASGTAGRTSGGAAGSSGEGGAPEMGAQGGEGGGP